LGIIGALEEVACGKQQRRDGTDDHAVARRTQQLLNHFRPEMVEVAKKHAEEQRIDACVRRVGDVRG